MTAEIQSDGRTVGQSDGLPPLVLPPAGWHWDSFRAWTLAQEAADDALTAMHEEHFSAGVYRYDGLIAAGDTRWLDVAHTLASEMSRRWLSARARRRSHHGPSGLSTLNAQHSTARRARAAA